MKYELAKGVRLEHVGSELVAMLPSGDVVVLNESAAVVLQSLGDGGGDGDDQVAQAAAALELAYGISSGEALKDADRTLSRLHRAGVLVPKRIEKSSRLQGRGVGRRAFVAYATAAAMGLLDSGTALGKDSASSESASKSGSGKSTKEGWNGSSRVWTDSLGRKVKLPAKIFKVAPYGPYAQSLLETIDPEMIVQASARGMHASTDAYAKAEAKDLVSQAGDRTSLSAPVLDHEAPDLVLDVGVSERRLVTEIEAQAGAKDVPVVHLIASPGCVPQAYQLLGDLLGRKSRCEELAKYVASIDAIIAKVKASVPEAERKTVYFGEWRDGLSTRGAGTLVDSLIKSIGAVNYAETLDRDELGNVPIGLLAEHSPDVAVLNIPDYYVDDGVKDLVDAVWGSSLLGSAVPSYVIPAEPVPWLGAAPLFMQTLGALWLAKVTYPDNAQFDARSLIGECLEVLFGIELSESDQLYVKPAGSCEE